MTSKMFQIPCSREQYWKILLNTVFSVDTDCYVMKNSSKLEKTKCKNCMRVEVENDEYDLNRVMSSPSMKEIYKNTHIVIRNLFCQKTTEGLSSNIFNTPMTLPENVRLFA